MISIFWGQWASQLPHWMQSPAAASSTDDANKLYQQAEEILLNDLPAIPLYYSNASGVASLNVKSGYAFDWQNLPTYAEMSKK